MEFSDLILIPKLDGVILHNYFNLHSSVEGTLCITSHHLLLSSRQSDKQGHELWLLHKNIEYIEKKPFFENNVVVGGMILLKCKDLRIIPLEINFGKSFYDVASSLEKLCCISNLEQQYPFFYRPMYSVLEDGFKIFSSDIEFSKLLATEEWRISKVNTNFAVCPTYEATIIVPKTITDDQIIQAASFRDGGRFPVISYKHENGAILLKSSQPKLGQGSKRCRADEDILNVVLGPNTKGFIVNTWSKSKSNTETDQHYSQWKIINRPICNISSPSYVLDSFSRLIEGCIDIHCSEDKWLFRLESSGWLNLVLSSLNVACVIAQCLDKECSPVLVHGEKSYDSTLIVISLVQIILNPDCRTVRGLQALIEREWIKGGYPFTTRHKYSCYTPNQNRPKTAGASFVLFLDCTYQIFCQFPYSFEFGPELLICLFEHSYFSQYGTFLGDSEKQRHEINLKKRTISLWSYINRPDILKMMLNPFYEPNSRVIWPSVAPISLELWAELYLRWITNCDFDKCFSKFIYDLVVKERELRVKVLQLRKELTNLKEELII